MPVPTAYVLVVPVPERVAKARAEGVSVVTLARGISIDLAQAAPWQLLGAKTLSYATNMAALRFAHRMGADDVIFTSTKNGVLPGVTQRALFTEAKKAGWECRYAPLFTADLLTCDSIWMLSSVTLAARVNSLDGLRMSAPDNAEEIIELVDRGVQRAHSRAAPTSRTAENRWSSVGCRAS
ncbi:Probable aminotransferase, class IV [Mycobacteroides abscessus subsp. abscessus]|nr:Probable aminotransferase, class IV [Mycobacteroides abscessus subsp. abscessus]